MHDDLTNAAYLQRIGVKAEGGLILSSKAIEARKLESIGRTNST